jgi:hypothetical protein
VHARRRAAITAAALTAGILIATLWPIDDETAPPAFRWCLTCGGQTLDAVLNVVGFMPLGLALGRAGLSVWQAALFGLLLSSGIESTQASLVTGRHGELRDVVTNTLGAGLGVWAGSWIRILWRPAGSARLLVALSALAFVGVTSGTAYLLRPAWPPYRMHGQAGPDRPPHPRFQGRLEGFDVAGIPVPADRLRPEAEAPIRAAIQARRLEVRAIITTGPAAQTDADGAPIALLVAGRRDLVRFAQVGRDAAFTIRSHGERLGLEPLYVRVADVFRYANAEVTLKGTLEPDAISFEVRGPDGSDGLRVPLTTALGWVFVSPIRGGLQTSHEAWSAAWLTCLALPIGFYSAMAVGFDRDRWRRLVRAAAIAAIALTVGLALVPVATALAPSPPLHWFSSMAGIAAGALLGAWRNHSAEQRRRTSPASDR